MMTLEELAKKKEQEALLLKEAIERMEQEAADRNCSLHEDPELLVKWLKELQEFREEWKKLEEPFDKEYRYLQDDIEQLVYLANDMAFESPDVSREQGFVWRSVKEIVLRALHTFKRAKYFEKQEVSNQ